MKRKIFIVCYYGKWPPYLREWLYSVRFLGESGFDFLLVSDINLPCEPPDNVIYMRLSMEEIRKRIGAVLGFDCALSRPYKLCDYKPSYGLIFEKEIEGYDFWGHCDIDILWGEYGTFIPEEVFLDYDKIQYLGHSVLYRNCPAMNRLFMQDGGEFCFKEVFQSDISFSFDEHPGMCGIAIHNNVRQWVRHNQADLSPAHKRPVIQRTKNFPYQIVCWEDGRIIRYYLDEDSLRSDSFSYLHFQKKSPKGLNWNRMPHRILFTTEQMIDISEEEITPGYILNHCNFSGVWREMFEAFSYRLHKLMWFLRQPMEQKRISIRIRRATDRVNRWYKEHQTP